MRNVKWILSACVLLLAASPGLGAQECGAVADGVVQAEPAPFDSVPSQQRAQALDDLACAQIVAPDIPEDLHQFVARQPAGLEHRFGGLGIAQDRRQRLVNLVRDRQRSLEMMAACMAMQGRHAEILDLLAPALQMQPDPRLGLGLRFSMGVACEALGRRGEARQHFEAIAQIDSSYRDVGARLRRF